MQQKQNNTTPQSTSVKGCLKNNDNRQNERCRASARLKSWWGKLSKEEKCEWFQRNRGLDKNKRKTFDNMTYCEKQATKRYEREELIVDYVPFSEFKEDEEKAGRRDPAVIQQNWLSKLNDRATKKRKSEASGASPSSGGCVRPLARKTTRSRGGPARDLSKTVTTARMRQLWRVTSMQRP